MSLGELPINPNFRVYYKLEDETDSGVNGYDLTNSGSVLFNAGKFNNGANFGTSGSKALYYPTSSIFSALAVPNITCSFWVKFNSISDIGSMSLTQYASQLASGTGALRSTCSYTISSSNVTFTATTVLQTTNAVASITMPVVVDKWYSIIVVKRTTTIVDLYINGMLVATNTGSGVDRVNVTQTYYLAIGNRTLAPFLSNPLAVLDEYIIEEISWSASEIRKYYTQGVGRFLTQQ